MKKLVLLIALFGFFSFAIMSCGGKQENASEQAEGEDYGEYETAEKGGDADGEAAGGGQQQASAQDLIKQGQALVDQSDCKTCHHQTNKIIGPAHADVAKKYDFTKANVTYLADKIKNGGSGVWGEIPMTPHPDLSQADAEKMAMYVLSLDNEEPKL
ncbi:MAG TPA: c-type cytochrome [Chryseosolibacter sp.]|nr:c-type cytochrome [Chryseosolibacter sp.]